MTNSALIAAEANSLTPPAVAPPRIARELEQLIQGGQIATYRTEGDAANGRPLILYRAVPVLAAALGLPFFTDVLVPVPGGYPAGMIDLAGLPVGSPLLSLAKGGTNNQGIVQLDGRQWQLASYHPHNGGGGQPWDQTKHGFHTYFDELVAWLAIL